jgi:hypothetical protein
MLSLAAELSPLLLKVLVDDNQGGGSHELFSLIHDMRKEAATLISLLVTHLRINPKDLPESIQPLCQPSNNDITGFSQELAEYIVCN